MIITIISAKCLIQNLKGYAYRDENFLFDNCRVIVSKCFVQLLIITAHKIYRYPGVQIMHTHNVYYRDLGSRKR